jgi:hypothetical protein
MPREQQLQIPPKEVTANSPLTNRVHPLDLEEVKAGWQGMLWEQTQKFIDAGMRYVIGDTRE